MRIVVTGALGHIGSRLVPRLARTFRAHEILMVDDLSTGRPDVRDELLASARCRFVAADVLQADLHTLFGGARAVVHLAAITDAPGSFAMPDRVERINLEGTRRVAQACAAAGVPLLFPSTTSVYGLQAELVDEDCATLRPQSPYAGSKLAAEQVLARLGRDEGLRFVTCRFGTIFGTSPGMRFHTAVNRFCLQAANGEALHVWRDTFRQHRPYLDLGDAVRAVEFIVANALFDGRIYNVLTLNATAEEVCALIRARVPGLAIEFVDAPLLNQHSYRVARERFERAGFRFEGDLARGIDDTLAWIDDREARREVAA